MDRLDIRDRVIVLPNVQEIGDYPNACDIGVYASEQESFGLGILETLAYGKPVVATRTGGIPEVIRENETGLLVPVGQPAALAAALDLLIDNRALREQYGHAALLDVTSRFNAQKIKTRYLDYYRRHLRAAGA